MDSGKGDWGAADVTVLPPLTEVQEAIGDECDRIANMLIAKNRKYGNSVLNPLRMFCKADAEVQLRARIDDKLSRYMNSACEEEDTVLDLIGYLVLLRVKRRMG